MICSKFGTSGIGVAVKAGAPVGVSVGGGRGVSGAGETGGLFICVAGAQAKRVKKNKRQ